MPEIHYLRYIVVPLDNIPSPVAVQAAAHVMAQCEHGYPKDDSWSELPGLGLQVYTKWNESSIRMEVHKKFFESGK